MLDQYAAQNNIRLVQSGSDYNRVRNIMARLERAAGLRGSSYPVYIGYAGNQRNAFALNLNTIVVYKSLLDVLPKDNELAVILAHEVSHVLAMHSEVPNKQETLASILITTATGSSQLGSATQQIGTGAFVLSYNRAQEYEADHVGLLLMAKAGYDPRVAISFWKNADSVLGTGSNNAFLSSHPTHNDRLERLNNDMPYALALYSGQ